MRHSNTEIGMQIVLEANKTYGEWANPSYTFWHYPIKSRSVFIDISVNGNIYIDVYKDGKQEAVYLKALLSDEDIIVRAREALKEAISTSHMLDAMEGHDDAS